MSILGCDLYELTDVTDYHALAQSISFAMVRLTDGTQRPDTLAAHHAAELWAEHVAVGFYHEIDPYGAPAGEQAQYALSLLNRLDPNATLAFGMEDPTPDAAGIAYGFALTLVRLGQKPPIIYIDGNMLAGYDWTQVVGLGCGLWLAQWDGVTDPPQSTAPFPFAAIKQYSDAGALAGVAGAIDLDVFYGDTTSFALYGGQGGSS